MLENVTKSTVLQMLERLGVVSPLTHLHITHDDFDAAGGDIVFKLVHRSIDPTKIATVYCSNGTVDETVQELWDAGYLMTDTRIYISDIVPTRPTLERMKEWFKYLCVLDHHKSNLWANEVMGTESVILTNEKGQMESGASLMFKAFQVFLSNDFPKRFSAKYAFLGNIIDTVRSYDTYEWKDTGNFVAKDLQVLFSLLGMERFVAKYVSRINSDDDNCKLIHDSDMVFVEASKEQEQQAIDAVTLDDVYIKNIKGYKCALRPNTGRVNISELAHQFLNKHKDIDVFIGFNLGGSFAFRTIRDDIDTGTLLAKPIKILDADGNILKTGGGHPKASGAPMPEQLRQDLIGEITMFLKDPDNYWDTSDREVE